MNNKGFTLIEVLAVLVLMTIITLLAFPSISNLMKSNHNKTYVTYEDMMIEYTKVYPNYLGYSTITLTDLRSSTNLPSLQDANCTGCVNNSNGVLTAYLTCTKNDKEVYRTNGYSCS